MRNMMKRLGLALIMLALLVSTLSVQAMAATGSINGLSIATSGSTGKISTGTNSVTLTVSKGWSLSGGTSEDTFTFTHPSTSTSDVQVSFDYSFSGTAKTISGVTEDTGTKCSVTLSPGGSFSVYVKATTGGLSSATSTFSITNLSVVEVVDSAQVTVDYDAALGSVTVDGSAVDAATVLTVPSSGASFVASPSGDVSFLAWVDGTGKIVSREKSYVCKPTEATLTLKAVFATTTPWFYVDNGDYLVEGWEEAVTHTGTVALANNATLPAGDYSVPSGVTMLIPYDSALTASVEKPVVATPASSEASPTPYRTLILEDGAHITVNGVMTVPSKVRAGDTTLGYGATMVKGTYGHVAMSSGSSITIKSGAKLSAYGYITGSGSVVAESGAKVYEAFQVMRFRGGSATSGMATAKKSFPISQYYVQNIEVPLTLYSGASEVAYVALYMSSTVIDSQVEYIGQSGCLFNLTSGYMVKQYDKANDRQQIDFYGDLTVSKFAINIKYIINYSIDSNNFVMPITNNMTVDIHDGATVNIGANMSLLPGAEIDIHEGGTLKVSSGKSLYLYDLSEWSGKGFLYGGSDLAAIPFAPNRTKIRTASDLKDAQIVVNGTLDASAGKLYTSTGGAAIKGAEGGQVKLTFASSTVDRQATQSGTDITYHDITMNSAYLQHGNGEYMVTNSDTYTYSDGVWNCTNHTYDAGVATTPATCTDAGVMTYTCTACGETKTEEISATGHTEAEAVTENNVDATCTTAGSYESVIYCSVCSEEVSRTKVTVDALGHQPGAEATCATAQVCTREGCGAILAEATGAHSYTVEIEGSRVAATCMAEGSVTMQCAACPATQVQTLPKDSNNHTGNNHTENASDATCTEAGYTGDTVCECGAIVASGITIEATGHTYGTEWKYDETNHWHECSCGAKSDETVHTYTSEVTKAATCTEAGETTYTCECGHSYTEVIEPTGHKNTVAVNAKEATCGADGYTGDTYCNDCKTTIATGEVIQATGNHVYTWTTTTAATCVSAGVETGTCSCGAKTTREIEIDSDAHSLVNVEAKAATCTQSGWNAYEYCDREGCSYTTYEESPATGAHSDSETDNDHICDTCDLVMSECSGGTATCEKKAVCTTCGAEYGELAEHTPADAVEENRVESTCTVAGSYDSVVKCSVCGEELSRKNVALELAAHVYDKEVAAETYLNTAATCKDKATYFKSCTCGAKGAETFAYGELAEHTPGEAVEDNRKEPTATESGSYDLVVSCTVCGTELSRETVEIPATGEPEEEYPEISVTKPANETSITHSVETAESGWTLTLTAEDTENTYVYLVKYTNGEGTVSEKLANADGKYSDGDFAIPEDAKSVTVESALAGDANLNGSVNAMDVTHIRKYLAKTQDFTELKLRAADVNQNGPVNAMDVTRVRKYLAKEFEKF